MNSSNKPNTVGILGFRVRVSKATDAVELDDLDDYILRPAKANN